MAYLQRSHPSEEQIAFNQCHLHLYKGQRMTRRWSWVLINPDQCILVWVQPPDMWLSRNNDQGWGSSSQGQAKISHSVASFPSVFQPHEMFNRGSFFMLCMNACHVVTQALYR